MNPARPGAAYGYVDMGGWVGGQAEYVMVPYADFNLIKFPNKEKAMAKIKDLTLLSDIFPTGYHGCIQAGVGPGTTVYIAGAGPVGLGCRGGSPVAGRGRGHRRRHDSGAPGAGQELRLRDHRPPQGCHAGPADRADPRRAGGGLRGRLRRLRSARHRQGRGVGSAGHRAEFSSRKSVRAGGSIGIPGLYVTGDPGGVDENAKIGALSIRIGLGWAKSCSFDTGQCPVLRYNRQLMMAILHDKVHPAKAVNVTIIELDEAPQGYKDFDKGAAKKFVIDPHGSVKALNLPMQ